MSEKIFVADVTVLKDYRLNKKWIDAYKNAT